MIELIISLLLLATAFCLPSIAGRLARRQHGRVPSTDHLSNEERWVIRRRFLGHPRLWITTVAAVGGASLATAAIYVVPDTPGLVMIAAMLGVPFLVAVALIIYMAYPALHRTVSDELKRLGKLLTCPTCEYDLSGLTASVCPECGTELANDR